MLLDLDYYGQVIHECSSYGFRAGAALYWQVQLNTEGADGVAQRKRRGWLTGAVKHT